VKAIETITGPVSVLNRDDVDTDQIIPKQFLKRVERTGFGEFLFYDWAKEPDWDLPRNEILVAGRNFGCGSSREHAPWALEDYGFRAIIAPSFADIFRSNCTKIGLLPVELPAEDVRAIAEAREAQVDLAEQEVRWPGGSAGFDIDPDIKHRLLEGPSATPLPRTPRRAPRCLTSWATRRPRRRSPRAWSASRPTPGRVPSWPRSTVRSPGLMATHVVPRIEDDAPSCRVIGIVVAPRHRRAGVASALMAAAEAQALPTARAGWICHPATGEPLRTRSTSAPASSAAPRPSSNASTHARCSVRERG